MAEEANFGVARLRQAITNQATCGSGQFELSIDSADRLCREIEDQITRFAWAEGVPAPKDADGMVVPLDTKVMYTQRGKKIELSEFYLLHSVLSGGFVWRAIRDTDHGLKDLKLDFLYLRRPNSWEQLEEDVERCKNQECACAYFGRSPVDCAECPSAGEDCFSFVVRDVLRRAKALAERDAKGADRG